MQRGSKHTEETKAKMSAAKMGHITSEETKAKISASKKGKEGLNAHHIGMKRSEETKAKMSAAHKARWVVRKAALAALAKEE